MFHRGGLEPVCEAVPVSRCVGDLGTKARGDDRSARTTAAGEGVRRCRQGRSSVASRGAGDLTEMASPFQEHLDFVLQDLRWTEWSPLPLARRTPERYRAGIYEVRQAQGEVVYVGQTGDFFTTRMGALGGIFQEVMPFNDPHTAGPCLWALRRSGAEFEARFSPTGNLSEQERRALETVELARLRRAMVWPIANYGGMPMGWVKSSNRRQARRGGPGSNEGVEKGPPWVPSELRGDPMSLGFGERDWSEWQPLTRGAGVGSPGIYRAKKASTPCCAPRCP